MKKVVLFFLIAILVVISVDFFKTKKDYEKVLKENDNIIIEIDKISNDIKKIDEDNIGLELKLSTLQQENEEKIVEQNIWLEMKKKLEQALS